MLSVSFGGTNYFVLNNGTYNGSLLDNTWHHVAIVRSGTLLSFYADGTLLGTRTVVGSADISSTASLRIGHDIPTNNTFEGVLSQVRIWNQARPVSAIQGTMNLELSGSETGLTGYWPLNEGNGQVVTDKTGTANGQLGSSSGNDNYDPEWLVNCEKTKTTKQDTKVLFPNPINTELNIKFLDESQMGNDVKVWIYNNRGERIKEITKTSMNRDSLIIPVKTLTQGLYIIKIQQGANSPTIHRIMKR